MTTRYLSGSENLPARWLSPEGQADLIRLRQIEPRAYVTGGVWGSAHVVRNSGPNAGIPGHPLYCCHVIIELPPGEYPGLEADLEVRTPSDANLRDANLFGADLRSAAEIQKLKERK